MSAANTNPSLQPPSLVQTPAILPQISSNSEFNNTGSLNQPQRTIQTPLLDSHRTESTDVSYFVRVNLQALYYWEEEVHVEGTVKLVWAKSSKRLIFSIIAVDVIFLILNIILITSLAFDKCNEGLQIFLAVIGFLESLILIPIAFKSIAIILCHLCLNTTAVPDEDFLFRCKHNINGLFMLYVLYFGVFMWWLGAFYASIAIFTLANKRHDSCSQFEYAFFSMLCIFFCIINTAIADVVAFTCLMYCPECLICDKCQV